MATDNSADGNNDNVIRHPIRCIEDVRVMADEFKQRADGGHIRSAVLIVSYNDHSFSVVRTLSVNSNLVNTVGQLAFAKHDLMEIVNK